MAAEDEKVWKIYKSILMLTDEEFESLRNTLDNMRDQYVSNLILIANEKRKSLY